MVKLAIGLGITTTCCVKVLGGLGERVQELLAVKVTV